MPYNGAGAFIVSNTFTPSTTISSSAMNSNFADIADGLSNALTRDNQAPMLQPIRLPDGAVNLPAVTFANDTNTGLRRSGADEMRWVAGGADAFYIDASGKAWFLGDVNIAGDLAAGGLGSSMPTTGGVFTGLVNFSGDNSPLTIFARGTSGLAALSVNNTASPTPGAAVIMLHRPGAFAAYFGLDIDNKLRFGGYSAPSSYRIFHEGEQPTISEVSGLQAALDAKATIAALNAAISTINGQLAAKITGEDETSASATNYEMYSYLFASSVVTTYGRAAHQNQTIAVYAGSGSTTGPNIDGVGSALAGTWRCRGGMADTFIVQRVPS